MIKLSETEQIIFDTIGKRKLSMYQVYKQTGISQAVLSHCFSRKRNHLSQDNINKLLKYLKIEIGRKKNNTSKQALMIKYNKNRIFNDFLSINENEIEAEQYTDELREFCTERNYVFENTRYINSVRSAFYCYMNELIKVNHKSTTEDIKRPYDFPDFRFDMYKTEVFNYKEEDYKPMYLDNEVLESDLLDILDRYQLPKSVIKAINSEINKLNPVPF